MVNWKGFGAKRLWLKPFIMNFFTILYNNSVRTSQETHHITAAKPNRLMLFKEIIAIYCENHTKHTNTLHGQNA
jgi:hypothetical protein